VSTENIAPSSLGNPFISLAQGDFIHRLGPIVERTVKSVPSSGGTAYVSNVLAALRTRPPELTPAYRQAWEDLAVTVSADIVWEAKWKSSKLPLPIGELERIWRKVEECRRLALEEVRRGPVLDFPDGDKFLTDPSVAEPKPLRAQQEPKE
jgi:hypothetical protein